MRAPAWSLALLLAAPAALSAQTQSVTAAAPPGQTAQAPPLNPGDPKLDALLAQWEQRMKGLKAIQANVIRTETDAIAKKSEVFEGTAKFLRPDRADLYLVKRTNPPQPNPPTQFERFLLTGTYLYEFKPKDKVIRVHTLPQRAAGQPAVDDNFLGLLFGMSAQEAKRRYDLQLAGSDANYYYLIVKPRLPADRAEFNLARLVLWAAGPQQMLPRQIEFVQPNGDPIRWDIPMINPNAPLGPTDFARPQMQGWQVVNVPPPATAPGPAAMPPPTRVRQSGGN